jgi:hypothetical protein
MLGTNRIICELAKIVTQLDLVLNIKLVVVLVVKRFELVAVSVAAISSC